MEALQWIRESENLFGNNEDLVDGYVETSGQDNSSESSNTKRKVESLFCVMRKRICRHNSVDDDIFPDFDRAEEGDYGDDILNFLGPESDFMFENLMDNPYDSLDEGFMVGDFSCSDTDTDLSESSEFDIISEHVVEDKDLITELTSQSIWPSEDEGTLVSKRPVETQSSKEDGVLSVVSASRKELQRTFFPQICYGHHNDISLFHSEWKIDKISCIPGLCEDIRCSVSKEYPEIQCNSDIFKNDGDRSSEIEVICRDVVNIEGSMENICSNDELRLWNKDDEPIPISIVPPDGWSKELLETCSAHQIDIYNIHDDDIGLEISPTTLRKTLETPNRPWSVCGSVAAVRNLPLVEGSSGVCSSLNEQLYGNVSNYEDMDVELAQTPSTLYQEEVDGEDDISFSDIDAMIRRLNLVPDDSDSNREEWNNSDHPRHAIHGLKHSTGTSMRRALVSQRALAVLHCRDSKHFVRKREVVIGRSSDGLNVDIDLSKYGYGSKISRRQALVKLENYGSFTLKNLGKQHIYVNGEKLDTEQTVNLTSCSSIEIRGVTFVFKINKEAVKHLLKNNTPRKSEVETKFRWCE